MKKKQAFFKHSRTLLGASLAMLILVVVGVVTACTKDSLKPTTAIATDDAVETSTPNEILAPALPTTLTDLYYRHKAAGNTFVRLPANIAACAPRDWHYSSVWLLTTKEGRSYQVYDFDSQEHYDKAVSECDMDYEELTTNDGISVMCRNTGNECRFNNNCEMIVCAPGPARHAGVADTLGVLSLETVLKNAETAGLRIDRMTDGFSPCANIHGRYSSAWVIRYPDGKETQVFGFKDPKEYSKATAPCDENYSSRIENGEVIQSCQDAGSTCKHVNDTCEFVICKD